MAALSTLELQEKVTKVIEQSDKTKQRIVEMLKELDDEVQRSHGRMNEAINNARQRFNAELYHIKLQRDRLQQHLDFNKEQSPCG